MQKRTLSRTRTVILLILLAVESTTILAPRQASAQGGQEQQPRPEGPDASESQKPDIANQVIHDVLEPFQSGFEGHTPQQTLSVFDTVNMPDYAHVRDQLTAFFRQYDPIHLRYKVLQTSWDKDRVFTIAEIDMAATPVDQNQTPVQRNAQMRFQLKLGPEGWRIVAFTPADFFSQP